ncbi:MAG TPA: hypothetical protein VKE22_13485, partial [Haliangiales bacterium]|nr:hypothetical protein [Haliangiales bacterium]
MRAGVAALAVMLAAGAARADEIVLTYVGFHITVLRKEHSDAGRKACDAALGSFALAVDDADLSPLKAPDAGRAAALAPAPTPTPPNRAGAPTA